MKRMNGFVKSDVVSGGYSRYVIAVSVVAGDAGVPAIRLGPWPWPPLGSRGRDPSAAVVSVARGLGTPPCGAFDAGTERGITTAVNTVPATIDPPMASTDGVPRVPGTTGAATNGAAPVPVGVSETAYRPVSSTT